MTTAIKKGTLTYKEGAPFEASIFLQSGEIVSLENFISLRDSEGVPAEETQAELARIFGNIPLTTDSTPESKKAAPFGSPVSIGAWLDADPPEREEILKALLMRGIVGGLFAQGGTGKTYILTCLAISAALGRAFFRTFKPSSPLRVLVFFGEDPPEMIHRRVKNIIEGFDNINDELLAQNLKIYCGKGAPLMQLKNGNPSATEAFDWLKAEVEDFKPDLIIIDPKSMFYGLDENNNDHNTQWINTLKELTLNGGTVLFSHHVTKALSGTLELGGARGGSALVDGSRFAANMRQMTAEDADKYNIEEPWRYVEFRVTKNSYVPKLPGSIFFKFIESGALEEVDLQASREFVLIDDLVTALEAEAVKGNFYTAREIQRGAVLPDFTERDRKEAVKLALDSGRITAEKVPGKTNSRAVLVPENVNLANVTKNECAELVI